MNRTDAYVTAAVLAWLTGAYMISEGHKARAAALDRQTTAEKWCSIEYAYAYGSNENEAKRADIDCNAISAEHRARFR